MFDSNGAGVAVDDLDNDGDLDQDGDLDLVTGSYDAELEQVLRDSFMFGGGADVF